MRFSSMVSPIRSVGNFRGTDHHRAQRRSTCGCTEPTATLCPERPSTSSRWARELGGVRLRMRWDIAFVPRTMNVPVCAVYRSAPCTRLRTFLLSQQARRPVDADPASPAESGRPAGRGGDVSSDTSPRYERGVGQPEVIRIEPPRPDHRRARRGGGASAPAAAGTTPLGAALSRRIRSVSAARYGVPSPRNTSWNQMVGSSCV